MPRPLRNGMCGESRQNVSVVQRTTLFSDLQGYLASSDPSACVEADSVTPEERALPLGVHLPVQHERDGLGEMALAMRIVRRIHQHVIADQIDDGVRQPGAFRDLDALKIAPAGDVIARLTRECRERGF